MYPNPDGTAGPTRALWRCDVTAGAEKPQRIRGVVRPLVEEARRSPPTGILSKCDDLLTGGKWTKGPGDPLRADAGL